MKKILVLMLNVPLMLSAGLWPQNVVAELATATWCGYCPQAYAGLEIMKEKYPIPDLVCVRYYSTSSGGEYGSAEIDARIGYYAVTGFPTCVFNGQTLVVGGGDATADGSRYDPVVSTLLTYGTPFGVDVDLALASGEATVTVTVKLHGDYSGTTPKLRIVLTEDDVTSEYTNLTRSVVTAGDVTITDEGQEQVIEYVFDVDAGWNAGKLHAAAFLQVDATGEVLQAGSSYPKPDYHYRLTSPVRIDRVAPSGTFTKTLYLTNVGSKSDQFSVTLDDSALPSGWTASLNSVTMAAVTLDADEGAEFEIEINPNGNSGQGDVLVEVSSTQGNVDQELGFRVITNDLDVNVVDDDGAEDFEKYFTAALGSIGETYGVWDINMGEFHFDNLPTDKTPVLIWSCGWSFPSLTKNQRDLLKYYLDGGGKLFLTGQDIGWDLCDSQSEDATTDSKQFYNNYLHAQYVSDDANNTSISGVAGDTITDGMSFEIAGGDGADNQEYPSIINPYDDAATTIFTYSTSQGAAIRAEKDSYKLVYLAFGYEAIDNATARRNLLEKALIWLGPAKPLGVEETPVIPTVVDLRISSIAEGSLVLYYNIPSPQGRLELFDALGRRVAASSLSETKGQVELEVRNLPRGCYFARLESSGLSATEKVILLH